MEDVVDPTAGIQDALVVADITDVEFQFGIGILFSHVILFFLVAAENADFGDVGLQEAAEDGVAERASSAAYEKVFFRKHKITKSISIIVK